MSVPNVLDVYPINNAQGIPIGDQVSVLFDQEMDLDSINSGTFIVSGPDDAPVFNPLDIEQIDIVGLGDEDILSSPYFSGYTKGTFTFQKVDSSGVVLDDNLLDTTGDGSLWNTKAIFSFEKALKPNSEYQCFLLGNDSGSPTVNKGIKARTVFDTVRETEGLPSSGSLTFNGGFTGTEEKTLMLEITEGGLAGTAEYIYWYEDTPLTTFIGVTSTGPRELSDGVYVECKSSGLFVVGDTFSVKLIPGIYLADSFRWSFFTGGGSILVPPSESSISGITDVSGETTLRVISITPNDKSTNLDPNSIQEIVITFNKALDSAIINNESISIWSEPVNGNLNSGITYTGTIAKILSVSGNKLTAQIS